MKNIIKSKAFLLTGVYALIGIYFAKNLIFLYQNGDTGINLLPINFFEILLFILTIIIVLVSFLTLFLLAKFKKIKISRNFIIQLFISLLVASIILFLVVQNGFNNLIIPVAIVIYGMILLNLSKRIKNYLIFLAFEELILGLIAFLLNDYDWLILYLSFGILPIIYGLYISQLFNFVLDKITKQTRNATRHENKD